MLAECATTVQLERPGCTVPFYERAAGLSEMIAAADRAALHSSRFFDHRGHRTLGAAPFIRSFLRENLDGSDREQTL
jgi:hypothetical protein